MHVRRAFPTVRAFAEELSVPLIAIGVTAYIVGLFAGFGGLTLPAVGAGALLALLATAVGRRSTLTACGLLVATGAIVAADSDAKERRARDDSAAYSRGASSTAFSRRRIPAAEHATSPLARWRERAGASIDTLFGTDAPTVRALLIADTKQLAPEVRDRYARAGLVHILSISGLHVAIISGAVLLALQIVRLPPVVARWLAVAITALYVAAIGAPPPALRSGAMLAAATAGRALQRPVSPWATLAVGALVPLLFDPRTVLELGYQLSVTGFASITAAGIWARRTLAPRLRGLKRKLATDLAVATVASFASAPLVAWHFARVSLIAPFSNIVAAPVVAVMQPALFLSLMLAPFGAPARLAADGARVLVRALDAIAATAAAVPGGSIVSAPSLFGAILGGVTAVCVVAAAAARRRRARWLVGAGVAMALIAWAPLVPGPARGMEVHMIDVGQGDAIAIRSPLGRWIVVDAGGGWAVGDAGRRIVVPYLRRYGGSVAMFVMTHPHDDHVGGAASLISLLRPADLRDAAFAGTSPAYRAALVAARERGIPWRRIHPGDSANIDGVVITFLAPDSSWTSSLTDPNLASAMMLVRFGEVRLLMTGDAEAAEEAWLLAHSGTSLRANILKVAHHGSATSTRSALLDAVRPELALVSVGARNRYRHPAPAVLDTLEARGVAVARTDLLGSIVVRTDVAGTRYEVSGAAGAKRVRR